MGTGAALRMRQRGVLAHTLLVAATSVHGWGAMFNRWGGGTHGKGGSRYNPGFNYDTSGQYYNMLTKSEEEDNDPCHQRKCTSNEHCCDGHVCVDTQNSVTGSCLPVFGKKEGEICYRDTDCETG